ncbi:MULTISPECIES: ABC transporter permease subunit [Paenibacillus]|uniref:ABC transporter permease n=1 Tax=Paenibacillus campinasensis TaxID=66347 RepID=A0A268EW35_9BACL|nr:MULTISPECIES: ABC transporter permease subunit [Paenibacillus]MUG68468.1 ABC transporter permease subunit [Paenibacillus campinasensis]PAD77337.1 ABC transporter permease [Paenibacillus campinasensis]PAK50322.1 ABC transporter permease [Paenibacillus sp. 7541]
MSLKSQMLKSTLISVFAFMLVVLIVLIPRDLNMRIEGYIVVADPAFKWSQFTENVYQFFSNAIASGSLGPSRYQGQSAEAAAFEAVGMSLLVIVSALFLGLVFGVLKGVADYKLSKTKFSVFGNWTTWLFQSMPDFFLMLVIQWYLVKHVPFIRYFAVEGWEAFVIPALLVSIYPVVYIARITSSSLAAQEGKLYIMLAKAKGLRDRVIVFKHMLLNGIGLILTHLPGLLVYILSNLFIVELYRNYPGASWRLVQALDFNAYTGTGPGYEPGIIIYICFSFMVLFLLVQWISHMARRFLGPQ